MRYRDAAHINLDSFYARKPQAGRWFRAFGYGLLAATIASVGANQGLLVGWLLLGLGLWICAWKLEVGALWRSSLVAQIIFALVLIPWERVWKQASQPILTTSPGLW